MKLSRTVLACMVSWVLVGQIAEASSGYACGPCFGNLATAKLAPLLQPEYRAVTEAWAEEQRAKYRLDFAEVNRQLSIRDNALSSLTPLQRADVLGLLDAVSKDPAARYELLNHDLHMGRVTASETQSVGTNCQPTQGCPCPCCMTP